MRSTFYGSAVDELRRLTRDTERFPLVYKGNTEYGFRRNLLGLKKIGLGVAIAALIISGWTLWHGWKAGKRHPAGAVRHGTSHCLPSSRLAYRGPTCLRPYHCRPIRPVSPRSRT